MRPNCFIFYVSHVAESVAFYTQLLGSQPLEQSPGFALFALNEGSTLGLWARSDVTPTPQAQPGAMEFGIALASTAEVDAANADWRQRGWPLLQAPTQMDFGYTATTADPDGHRIRVFKLTEM